MNAFTSLCKRTPAPAGLVALRLSRNSKTGVSLNLPIRGTCRPTEACRTYCYGLGGPIGLGTSLQFQANNLAALNAGDPDQLADSLAEQCRAAGATFLRVNGVGDLTPASVRVLSALATRHAWLTLWIATRKPDLARHLPDLPNVQIMLAIDQTTRAQALLESRWIVECRPDNAFLAYTRLSADDEAPDDVAVVFELHRHGSRAKWPADRRACAATVRDGAKHDLACESCRRCFDPEARNGQ